jgi:muramoyltetrapeptide carboxypeptidase LdcA involved in peptidoglycan recycling
LSGWCAARQDRAVPLRFPAPLVPGDRVGVTAPSAGVEPRLRPRLEVALAVLRAQGLDPVLGRCLDGTGIVSAPARDRADDLVALMTDPRVRAVVPPWGGELGIDLLGQVDWDRLGADPTWLVGYSDISVLLLALTLRTGVATLHGQNLMDLPYRVPDPQAGWLDVARLPAGSEFVQGPSTRHRRAGFDDWASDPTVTELTLDTPGTWSLLDETTAGTVTGRLVGGCLDVVPRLAGTPYGDVPGFAAARAPEGLVVYLEAVHLEPAEVARTLWGLRHAGWFDAATAVLVGRTLSPESDALSQRDAVRYALGDLGVPVVLDVDCGHVPPHLALVNGALAELRAEPGAFRLTQTLA